MRITSSPILAVTRAFSTGITGRRGRRLSAGSQPHRVAAPPSTGIDSTDQRKIHAIKTDASRPQQVRIFAVEWDWFQCYCPRL